MTDVTWINAGGHDAAILAVYNGQADAAFTFKDARTLVSGDYPDVYDEVIFVANTESIPNDTISVIPRLHPDLVAKIKAAATLGLVGDGGIGAPLIFAIKARDWERTGIIVIVLIITVTIIDIISSKIRKKLV